MTRHFTAGMLAVVLVAAAACGKSDEQKQAEENAKAVTDAATAGANQMAAGAAAMAKGLEQMAQGAAAGGKVTVLPFETLGAAFPEVSGWTRDEVKGTSGNFPAPMSQSETTYRNGNARVELEVVDAALAQILMAPFSMFLAANFSERSSDGYKKGVSIKGEPGFEDVNTRNDTAEVTVVVGKRFIINARGSNGAGIEPVRNVLEQMDFGKLTSAK